MRKSVFTLLELVLVVAIILIVSSLLWLGFGDAPEVAGVTKIKAEMQGITAGFTTYAIKHQKRAQSYSDIAEIVGESVDNKDPWGKEYKIEFDESFEMWRITCAGLDQVFETDDDIFSWK